MPPPTTAPTAPSPSRNWGRLRLLAMGLYLLGFAGCAWLSFFASLSTHLALVFLTGWVGAACGSFWVWCLGRGSTQNGSLYRLMASGLAVDVFFNLLAAHHFAPLHPLSRENLLATAFLGLGNLGVLTAAIGLGLWVGRGLHKPNYLVMASVVGGVTDIFSVDFGPSKLTSHLTIFPYVSLQWGVAGCGLTPIVGMGDFVFLALFFYGGRKFGLDEVKTLVAMVLGVGAGQLFGMVRQVAIPALPFFAAALLLVHGPELMRQIRAQKRSALPA